MMHASDYANMPMEQMNRKLKDNQVKEKKIAEGMQ